MPLKTWGNGARYAEAGEPIRNNCDREAANHRWGRDGPGSINRWRYSQHISEQVNCPGRKQISGNMRRIGRKGTRLLQNFGQSFK